jgi:hypothetical protein
MWGSYITNKVDYAELVKKAFGNKCYGYFLSFLYIIYAFGSGITYQIISKLQQIMFILSIAINPNNNGEFRG